jgi:hypothetical protein
LKYFSVGNPVMFNALATALFSGRSQSMAARIYIVLERVRSSPLAYGAILEQRRRL